MRFICDVMLGKLAKRLRLLGFDTVYARSVGALEEYSRIEGDRVFVTRRSTAAGFDRTVHIESEQIRQQLIQIKELIKSGLNADRVFHRCLECNAELADVEKTEIESLVPEFVFHSYAHFKVCPSCKRVYWEGSHTEGMKRMIKELFP